MTKWTLLVAGLASLALMLVTACSRSPNLQQQALELKDALAGLPGVERMELDYTEAGMKEGARFRGPATVSLTGRMAEDSTPQAVVEVFTTAYEALRTTHREEAGSLDLAIGDDLIHLRTLDPVDDIEAVEGAVERALSVAPLGQARVFIDTLDVVEDPVFSSMYDVRIPASQGTPSPSHNPRPSVTPILRALKKVESLHRGRSQDTWIVGLASRQRGLMSTGGFPSRGQRALFAELSADLPEGAALDLHGRGPRVKLHEAVTPDRAADLTAKHLGLIGGIDEAEYALVDAESGSYVEVSFGECRFAGDAIGSRLREEFGGECSTVSDAWG